MEIDVDIRDLLRECESDCKTCHGIGVTGCETCGGSGSTLNERGKQLIQFIRSWTSVQDDKLIIRGDKLNG